MSVLEIKENMLRLIEKIKSGIAVPHEYQFNGETEKIYISDCGQFGLTEKQFKIADEKHVLYGLRTQTYIHRSWVEISAISKQVDDYSEKVHKEKAVKVKMLSSVKHNYVNTAAPNASVTNCSASTAFQYCSKCEFENTVSTEIALSVLQFKFQDQQYAISKAYGNVYQVLHTQKT